MEDLANIENEEKQLITSFSNGQSPSGGDFQKLIEYINGQTIDCSLSAIQPIESFTVTL